MIEKEAVVIMIIAASLLDLGCFIRDKSIPKLEKRPHESKVIHRGESECRRKKHEKKTFHKNAEGNEIWIYKRTKSGKYSSKAEKVTPHLANCASCAYIRAYQ